MATYLGHQEDSSGNILLPTPHSMATQIEFGTTASQAYAKGAYVVFNNRLCKASTAIASGDTLAIGTNLVQCSIGSELNSHLQAPNGSEFYFDYKDNKPGFYPSASKVASEFVPFGGSPLPVSSYGWGIASGGSGRLSALNYNTGTVVAAIDASSVTNDYATIQCGQHTDYGHVWITFKQACIYSCGSKSGSTGITTVKIQETATANQRIDFSSQSGTLVIHELL